MLAYSGGKVSGIFTISSEKEMLNVIIHSTKVGINTIFAGKIVCLIRFFMSHQQSFSYVGTGFPGLHQY